MDKLIRTIKAVSIKKLEEGEIGFLTTDDETKWFNVKGPTDGLEILLDTTIQKGNTIEFEAEKGVYSNFILKGKGIINPPIKKEKSGDDMNNLDSLLNAAHKKGIISITTEMINIDYNTKSAVFKATVKGWVGDEKSVEGMIGTFVGHGDASPETLTGEIAKAWIRMGETRAICRALRWYTNNSEVADEELPESKNEPEKVFRNIRKEILFLLREKNEAVATDSLPLILNTTLEEINIRLKVLLETGIVFEPKPGFVKYLG